MALIGKIRKNMWLMIILIGLALAAFVIMDMTSGGGGAPTPNQTEVGEVDGEPIQWMDFQEMEQTLYAGSGADLYERRDYLWNYFVNSAIVNENAEKLGLTVGTEELMELQFGTNLSPIIRDRFRNPQTGQVDRQQLNQFRTAINQGQLQPAQRRFWQMQEKEIIQIRKQTKLIAMVSKGLYTPTWLAERNANLQSQQAKFTYVKVPFAEISDSEAQPTEDDYRNYLEENKKQLSRDEETRVAEFAVMDVLPTSKDTAAIQDRISTKLSDFETAENDSLFLDINQGELFPTYQLRGELDDPIQDVVFEMEIGEIYGPYMFEGAYKGVKLIDKQAVPDSVEARHIFRQVDPNDPNAAVNQRMLLDSLKMLVESGRTPFDSLAMSNSQDGSAQDGGNLGYFEKGTMLPAFESVTFYELEEDELKVFQSQAGLHLVQVLDKKFGEEENTGVKLGYLSENIIPSEETQNRLYEEALTLASENRNLEELRKTVESRSDLSIKVSDPLERNAYQIEDINSNEAARSIVRYIYESGTRVGDISPDVFIEEAQEDFYNQRYFVAGLNNIIPAGSPKLENIKSVITSDVLKKKKGELLKEAMEGKSPEEAAQMYSSPIDTAEGVALNAQNIRGIGNEPALIAALSNLNEGESAGPIVGENGVYMITLESIVEMPAMGNFAQIKSQTSLQARQRANQEIMEALKEDATIRDYRHKFY